MAIPLSAVARLEEFSSTNLEFVGNCPVAQYRGEILPLIDVSQELDRLGRTDGLVQKPDEDDKKRCSSAETLPVIVCADGERRVGLIVAHVLDIVHEQIAARSQSSRPGVLFAAVLQAKVTEFVDIATLCRTTPLNH